MSTIPGHETWRDAGLVEVDPAAAVEIEKDDGSEPGPAASDTGVEDYTPDDPRPDLRDEADRADVEEQAAAVPSDDRDDYP